MARPMPRDPPATHGRPVPAARGPRSAASVELAGEVRGGERLAGRARRRDRPTAATRPGAKTSSTRSRAGGGLGRRARRRARRASRRAATRTAPRRGSSGSRRAPRRGGSSPPSRARAGRRAGAPAGSRSTRSHQQRVEVGVGIGVEAALEVRHHEHPAGEHEQRGAPCLRERGRERVDVGVRRSPATSASQRGIAREPAEQHRDALGGERVGGAAQRARGASGRSSRS